MNRRVLIVDDHPIVRAGLEQALLNANFSICAVAASKNEAIAQIARTNPNLILLDLNLPDGSGFEVANWARGISDEIGIVILVPCTDLRLLGQVHADIPDGSMLVLKNSVTSIASLCDVLSKSRLMQAGSTPVWINGNLELSSKVSESMMSKLTNIQIETLRLVADGLTNAEIGRIRFVSEKAVEQIVSRISQVLNVQPDRTKNMRVQLVRQYFKWIGAPIQ